MSDDGNAPGWGKRLGWLAVIWAASVTALALVAWVIKLIMHSVGMSS